MVLRSFVLNKVGVQANIGEEYAHLRQTEEDLGSEAVFRMDDEWSIEFIMRSPFPDIPPMTLVLLISQCATQDTSHRSQPVPFSGSARFSPRSKLELWERSGG